MNNKFIIYSSQRSGSTFLSRALDNHPQILCAGALFRKNKSNRMKYPELSFNYAEKKKSRIYRWFSSPYIKKHLKFVFNKGRSDVTGFRLFHCNKMGVKSIVLIRKNIVRQAISLTIAQNAGLWIKKEESGEENSKIQLDTQRLGKNINYFQRCRTLLENTKFKVEPLVIYFEDLSGPNAEMVIKQVYQYLGVIADYSPRVKPMKRSIYKLEDRITNYQETLTLINNKGLGSLITEN